MGRTCDDQVVQSTKNGLRLQITFERMDLISHLSSIYLLDPVHLISPRPHPTRTQLPRCIVPTLAQRCAGHHPKGGIRNLTVLTIELPRLLVSLRERGVDSVWLEKEGGVWHRLLLLGIGLLRNRVWWIVPRDCI